MKEWNGTVEDLDQGRNGWNGMDGMDGQRSTKDGAAASIHSFHASTQDGAWRLPGNTGSDGRCQSGEAAEVAV